MSETSLHRLFNRARIDDRQINELVGLAHGIIADGIANQAEAEYLFKWLVANAAVSNNPVVNLLYSRIERMLADGQLDPDESSELLEALTRFCAGDFELGEASKAATLPLCDPAPHIQFDGSRFCFTGPFAFGSRRDCEAAVTELKGFAGSLTMKTRYVVVGEYATESWSQSSFGRKIEKAVEMRSNRVPISIVGEKHWIGEMRR